MIGQTLLHYEVTEQIGKGGMGEVFRATDSKLRRDVALKFLPPELVHDDERMKRFEREARVLAALSHPNIGAIYGLETVDERTFLVLELIAGDDLSEVLKNGPLPVERTVEIGRCIADALECAHEQGIVHRDLKPANVKITPEGSVKVLDFGLAKALETEDPDSSLSVMATRTTGRTLPGVVMGTAAYMSPEQARGSAVDRRTDIWAFGAVLFEMMTGGRVFAGETVSDILASVLKTDPAWEALPADTPPALRRLMERCFERDPRRRLRDIGEARIALEAIAAGETGTETATAPAGGGRGWRTVIAAAAVTGLVLAAAGYLAGSGRGGGEAMPGEPRRFDIVSAHDQSGAFDEPAISPDGRRVTYIYERNLWVRDLDRLDPRKLEGTEGAVAPFWSPDGGEIAYFAGGNLWRIPVDGGQRQLVCDLQGPLSGGRGGDWGSNGTIIFSRGSTGIFAAQAVGGDAREFIPLDTATEGDLHEPHWLPDGGVLFVVHPVDAGPGVLVVQYGDERTTILDQPGYRILDPRYVSSGHIIYERTGASNNGVWAVPYSLADRAPTGEPVLIVPEAREGSASADGQLVYLDSQLSGEELLASFDAAGNLTGKLTEVFTGVGTPALSPDGQHLAMTVADDEDIDIWIQDLRRGTRSRLTNEGTDVFQSWHPDGERFYFWSTASATIMTRTTDNTSPADSLTRGISAHASQDGRYLLLTVPNSDTDLDVAVLDLTQDGEPVPLVAGAAAESSPQISPDGRHFLYISDESGREEAYLREFPSGKRPLQVSLDGATDARWSPDGSSINFTSEAGLMAVSVTRDGDRIDLGRAELLFAMEEKNLMRDRTFGYLGDGSFVFTQRQTSQDAGGRAKVVLVENWIRLLGDR